MTSKLHSPVLAIIAERHLARARTALAALGIDTDGMDDAEVLARVQARRRPDGGVAEEGDARAAAPGVATAARPRRLTREVRRRRRSEARAAKRGPAMH
jgi:hypothetical protein